MNRGLCASVPVSVWNALVEHHERSWARFKAVAVDLDIHNSGDDVKQLVEEVHVQASWRAAPRRGFDIAHHGVCAARASVDEILLVARVEPAGDAGFMIYRAQRRPRHGLFHSIPLD